MEIFFPEKLSRNFSFDEVQTILNLPFTFLYNSLPPASNALVALPTLLNCIVMYCMCTYFLLVYNLGQFPFHPLLPYGCRLLYLAIFPPGPSNSYAERYCFH